MMMPSRSVSLVAFGRFLVVADAARVQPRSPNDPDAVVQAALKMVERKRLNENIVFSAGWVHGFRNDIESPIGQIPGSTARMYGQTDSILVGLTIRYGAKRTRVQNVSAGPPCTTQVEAY